ncbi:hypothetical protein [Pseudomonas aeruginosa]|uniref:Lipoprotein n=1 Tax=Pseudomonas phage vB_PaeM_PS119XW TaxID=2601632 RepID=A0A5C1K7D3_9CAUD|nr:hypothetical protein [Pseudomonas aeruginosa]YP_010660857.1 hypothetical protein PP933_gp117 [Pseudomonas phage vB_PaeM_PS119XW]MBW6072795.1 hypothetical protein [Pseudomonas aeruginosa]QBX32272.1 hypothetical protein [Pseudomonas phage PA1C]QEM41846.1 hypothetical protein [Pseudomonas phage vB_PaeM_PS119XW]
MKKILVVTGALAAVIALGTAACKLYETLNDNVVEPTGDDASTDTTAESPVQEQDTSAPAEETTAQ